MSSPHPAWQEIADDARDPFQDLARLILQTPIAHACKPKVFTFFPQLRLLETQPPPGDVLLAPYIQIQPRQDSGDYRVAFCRPLGWRWA